MGEDHDNRDDEPAAEKTDARAIRDHVFSADEQRLAERLDRLGLVMEGVDRDPALLSKAASKLGSILHWYRIRADLGSAARATKQRDRLDAIRAMESGARRLKELQTPERVDLDVVFLARMARRLDLNDPEKLGGYSIDGDLTQALIEELSLAAADLLAKGDVQNEPWHVARIGEPSWPKTQGWSAMHNLVAELGEWYFKYIGRRPTVTIDHHHGGKTVQPIKGGTFVEFVRACCVDAAIKQPSATTIEYALRKARSDDGPGQARRGRGWNMG
jgi:hypothetical protein